MTKKILKVSSRDGAFIRCGITFPPAPEFIQYYDGELTHSIINILKNEPALIVEQINDDTTPDNDTPPVKTVALLKAERDILVAKVSVGASDEFLDIIKQCSSGKNKADIEDDISSLQTMLDETAPPSSEGDVPTDETPSNTPAT